MKKGTGVSLTGATLDRIIDMYVNQGLGFKTISRILCCEESRVRQALVDAGIPIRPVNKTSPERAKAIMEDYVHSGLDTRALGRKHHVTEKVIARLVKEHNLTRLVQPVFTHAYARCGNKTAYQLWIERYGQEEADKRKAATRDKMSKSSWRRGKAAAYGGGKSWQGWYKGTYFRSLRELTYMVTELEREGVQWVSGEEKEWMMPYTDWDGKPKTYRADFVVLSTGRMIEVKPKALWGTPLVQRKKAVGEAWCKERGLTYALVDPGAIDGAMLVKTYLAGHIKWIERSQKRFEEVHGEALAKVV